MLRFGYKSRRELKGVHADLVIVTTTALIRLPHHHKDADFTVFDGVRSKAEQRENIRTGVSWTMDSLHLPQRDGFAHAVDLVPYFDGRLWWDSKASQIQARVDRMFAAIATAMAEAADVHDVAIQWGHDLWGKDKPHFQLDPDVYQ